jgi:hypothetical protein
MLPKQNGVAVFWRMIGPIERNPGAGLRPIIVETRGFRVAAKKFRACAKLRWPWRDRRPKAKGLPQGGLIGVATRQLFDFE